MTRNARLALLGSVTTTALFAFSSPASAQSCTINPVATPTSSVTCAAGATTNTTMTGAVSPTNDREYLVTTGSANATADVNGALTGNGLAITNTVGGANTLTVTNNGGITVDAVATPSVGGDSALNITGTGATTVVYGGNGAITSLNPAVGALEVLQNGTGNVTATVGGNLTGYFGADVRNTGTTGNVSLITNSGTTTRADFYGLLVSGESATGTGSVSVTNNGTVASLTGAPGTLDYGVYGNTNGNGTLTVTNNGAVGSATDAIVVEGVTAQKFGTTGNVTLANTGAVYSAGTGLLVNNRGSGATTVTNGAGLVQAAGPAINATGTTGALSITTGTGAVTSTGGVGILAANGTGATTITTGTGTVSGSTSGIQAATAGTQSITANGNVTGGTVAGIHSDTTANRTITVASGRSVTGGAEAILLTNTGTATINNNGTIGAASTGLALNGTAAGATTFNNNSGSTLNGRLTFGAGNDALVNAGTFNTQGTTDFGAGTDTFTNTGTLNLTGNTTFANLETTNLGGTTNLGAFTLNGTGAFNNTGTLNSNGGSLLGFTSQSNSGTLNLTGTTTVAATPYTNSGTINSVNGAATLTGQTSFTNTGTINMVDGAANDSLTINSSFNGGTGSRLAVDASDTMADMLIVTGAISGSTAVDANVIGTGALVNGGVQVVDGQSTSTANAFTLGNVMGGSALVDYAIVQNGSDYYLDASLNQAGFRPLTLAAAVPDFWYPSADEVIANLAVPDKGGDGVGFWADGYISREKYGDNNVDYTFGGVDYSVDQRVKFGHMGLQAGVDYGMGGTGRVGLTGGYSRHNGKGMTDLDAKGWNLGLYGAFGGVTGFHGEALAKYDRYKVDFNDGVFDATNPKVKAFGIDGSLGYRMPMGGDNSSLDLVAGLSHVTSKIDDINAYGLTYDYDRVKSTRGRASARYNIGGELQPYVQATAYHEFAKASQVALFDGVDTYNLATDKRGTWGRIEGGIGGSPNRFPSFGAWADFGDVKGIGARLGMRFGASAEAAPPPPPPMAAPAPVEQAPATQTCYDGSVILATDTCPLPPAPPPPAPMPERG